MSSFKIIIVVALVVGKHEKYSTKTDQKTLDTHIVQS